MAVNESARALARRGQTADQSNRPIPGEQSCLSLVWAALDLLITHETNGIRFNQLDRHRLRRMSYDDIKTLLPRR